MSEQSRPSNPRVIAEFGGVKVSEVDPGYILIEKHNLTMTDKDVILMHPQTARLIAKAILSEVAE